MSFKVFFLLLALATILFSRALRFYQFGRRSPELYFCEIILKSSHWPRRRCRLKVFFIFLVLAAILFSGVEQF